MVTKTICRPQNFGILLIQFCIPQFYQCELNQDSHAHLPLLPCKLRFHYSLFPNVPPTIVFMAGNYSRASCIPLNIKWGKSHRRADPWIAKSGFSLVDPLEFPNTWFGTINAARKTKRHPNFAPHRMIRKAFQKYNIIPGSEELADKEKFHYNLQRFIQKFGDVFQLTFETYSLPEEYDKFFRAATLAGTTQSWILKPNKGFMSVGVKIFREWGYIPKDTKDTIVQKYFPEEKQALIREKRVELRTYIVVTSFAPLRAYLYKRSTLKVFEKTEWKSENENIGMEVKRRDKVMDSKMFFEHLRKSEKSNMTAIKEAINDIIVKALLVGQSAISRACSSTMFNSYNAYQMWTFDFIFEKSSTILPRLLEVNRYGGLFHKDVPDFKVALDMLNLVGYHLPPTTSTIIKRQIISGIRQSYHKYLPTVHNLTFDGRLYQFKNSSEKALNKINQFENSTRLDYLDPILSNLTRDDIRQLVTSEDEFFRSSQKFERIFPTAHSHKYLKYLESDKYSHYLQEAWEAKYRENRIVGISLLRKFASQKKHLRI